MLQTFDAPREVKSQHVFHLKSISYPKVVSSIGQGMRLSFLISNDGVRVMFLPVARDEAGRGSVSHSLL